MDKKVWCHPFASNAVKRKFWKSYHKPKASADGLNTLSAATRGYTRSGESRIDPWIALFDDPSLHEALDRIMACNRID